MKDKEKDKELRYMIEQDSNTGKFVGNREEFDKIWDNEEYCPSICFYLERKYLIFD